MPGTGTPIRILLVRSWLHGLEPVRAALREGGFAPTFIRTDIEPALNAALTRGGIDLVLYDPSLEDLNPDTIAAQCKKLRPGLPVLEIGELAHLARRIRAATRATTN